MVMTMNPMGSHHDLFSKGVGVVMRGTRENSNVDIVSSTLGSDVEAMSMKVGGIGAMEIVRMGFTGRLRSKCGHLVVENDVTLGASLHQDHRPRDESVEESSGEGDVGVVNRDSLDNKVDRDGLTTAVEATKNVQLIASEDRRGRWRCDPLQGLKKRWARFSVCSAFHAQGRA